MNNQGSLDLRDEDSLLHASTRYHHTLRDSGDKLHPPFFIPNENSRFPSIMCRTGDRPADDETY